MTTTTAPTRRRTTTGRLTAGGVIRSEWIKLRSVRSTLWCYGLIVLLVIGIGVLASSLSSFGGTALTGDAARSTVVSVNTAGLNIAVLIAAVLGSLIITGEYSTGMIRSTFAAVPRRTGAIAAKAVVLAVTTFLATSVGIWVSALITSPILAAKDVEVQLGEPSVFLPLLGGAVFVTMIALLAFGFGIILRSTAGTLATALGLLLVVPIILSILGALTQGADWVTTVSALMPQSAGSKLFGYASTDTATVSTGGGLVLNGWGGFGVLSAWVVAVLALALTLVKRRDA
ncbi:ABC transporter permease subunit [Microbacterium sp.]|uniref:ABC transporter permease subunit n=1 Tax=Microbacterium sp. TaxID=51671 RepID=UPI001AD37904|nr:ABC transporter permease subunit [Microbacterium sp.]MBN9187517.1 ABC transporter permease subunit [Microbacterium sp.]MBN9194190.1 ABC transporter permease subunit [Microbacterium sp.]